MISPQTDTPNVPQHDTVVGSVRPTGGIVPAADSLAGADNLAGAGSFMGADSLAGADTVSADSVFGFASAADSLFCAMPTELCAGQGAWRAAEAAEVFGEGSSLAAGVVPDSLVGTAVQPMAASADADDDVWAAAAVNLLVIGVVSVYMFCIYRYFDDVVALFRSVFRRSVMTSGRVVERRRSEIFYSFLGKLFLLGAAFVGVLAAETALRHRDVMTEAEICYVPLVAVGLFLAVVAAQYVLLAGIGLVTRSFSEVTALVRIRLVYFALATVMVAPVMLVAQISADAVARIWFAAGCVSACVAAFFFLRESLMFFITKKISILHWFLYLCTIEIMPLSLLWQAAVRLRL